MFCTECGKIIPDGNYFCPFCGLPTDMSEQAGRVGAAEAPVQAAPPVVQDNPSIGSIEWDLTNFANTPVASGFYLIHVSRRCNFCSRRSNPFHRRSQKRDW